MSNENCGVGFELAEVERAIALTLDDYSPRLSVPSVNSVIKLADIGKANFCSEESIQLVFQGSNLECEIPLQRSSNFGNHHKLIYNSI